MIGETINVKGTDYIAVAYHPSMTADFMPDPDGDEQCKLCALMPNYCNMKPYCHQEPPYVFVKTRFISAMVKGLNTEQQ